MRQAQSYIVRVYMRRQTSHVIGTVEIVGSGKRTGFSSANELLSILVPTRSGALGLGGRRRR